MAHNATTEDGGTSLRSELAEVLADFRGWLEWEQSRGAAAFPIEVPLSAAEMNEIRGPAPVAPPAAPAAVKPAPQRAARPAPPPARAAPPVQPAPVVPPPARKAEPVRASAPVTLGAWASYAAPAPTAAPVDGDDKLATVADLDGVREVLGECTRCPLHAGRRNIVFGVGAPRARVMVVGEGPGANEDAQGEPFVGKAGQMLDKMLENVLGLGRGDVYISNVVKCRPPGNRNPQADEIARCMPFLKAQLRVIRPEVVLVLGSVACRAVFDTTMGVTRLRGNWQELPYEGGVARAMPTFHPAYLLRTPADKRLTFEDLKQVKLALSPK